MLLCTARVLSTDAETLFTSAVSVTSLEELYAGHKRFQPLRRLYFLYYMYPYLFYRNACPTHSGHGTKLRHCVSLSASFIDLGGLGGREPLPLRLTTGLLRLAVFVRERSCPAPGRAEALEPSNVPTAQSVPASRSGARKRNQCLATGSIPLSVKAYCQCGSPRCASISLT